MSPEGFLLARVSWRLTVVYVNVWVTPRTFGAYTYHLSFICQIHPLLCLVIFYKKKKNCTNNPFTFHQPEVGPRLKERKNEKLERGIRGSVQIHFVQAV